MSHVDIAVDSLQHETTKPNTKSISPDDPALAAPADGQSILLHLDRLIWHANMLLGGGYDDDTSLREIIDKVYAFKVAAMGNMVNPALVGAIAVTTGNKSILRTRKNTQVLFDTFNTQISNNARSD